MRKRTDLLNCSLLAIAGAVVCVFLVGPGLVSTFRGTTDFMDLYAGAKLSFTSDQYNVPRVLATELQTTSYYSPTRLFMRLPVFGMLLWPLAQLPYITASAAWEIICTLAISAFVTFWRDRRVALIACCWSLPVWMTLAEGQDTSLLLVWLALAVLAIRSGRLFTAGLVMSLCAAKFQLFLLLPLWIIGNRAWRTAYGLSVGGSILLVGCFVAGGIAWPQHYFDLLRDPANNPYPELMPNLHALLSKSPVMEWSAIVAVVVLALLAISKLDFVTGLAPVLIGGVLVTPHDYMADCILLIPSILLLRPHLPNTFSKTVAVYLLTPIPYAALMLQIRLAVILPLVVLLFTVAFAEGSAQSIPQLSALCPSTAADSQA